MLAACLKLRQRYNLCAVTNDIFTREDAEFLVRNGALSEDRIMAVETGGCPHAAIRVTQHVLLHFNSIYFTATCLSDSISKTVLLKMKQDDHGFKHSSSEYSEQYTNDYE